MYSMKETCQKVGMSYETLKFYCNQGLIPNVKRNQMNHRVFDDRDIAWIQSLTCLKDCGMSLSEMKTYIDLCIKGEETIPQRKDILKEKKDALLEQMKLLQECINYIDRKQQFYNDVLSGKTKYFSNLIDTD